MSTPMRRTTARLAAAGAMALGSAGLLAGPALAQYPPPPINITVTTPGATIEVTGSAWEPGTVVTITRKNGNRAAADAAAPTGRHRDHHGHGPGRRHLLGTDQVPEEAGGSEIQYEVSGVDEQGAERTETRALNVQLTSAEMQDGADAELASPVAPAEDSSDAGWILALGGAAALAGGTVIARRKVSGNR